MAGIKENLEEVEGKIRRAAEKVGRDPRSARLMAVTKRVDADRINEALDAGVTLIGENRVQEARDKFPLLRPSERHLIGHLQKNKVKYLFDLFDMVQSVDSIELAREIDNRAREREMVMAILVQVNIGEEESKSGIEPANFLDLVKEISRLDHIDVKGLMVIPPFGEDPDASRPYFQQLVHLRDRVLQEGIDGVEMKELSMGMSNDYEVAVEEGATLLRVGSAIFGTRA